MRALFKLDDAIVPQNNGYPLREFVFFNVIDGKSVGVVIALEDISLEGLIKGILYSICVI